MKSNVIFLFSLDALLRIRIPEIGADIFEKYSSSACIIPSYVRKEIKVLTRCRRKEVRTQAIKLGLTIKDVCGFTDGENLGVGSKTFVAYHKGVQAFLPNKYFARITKESKTIAIARYLQDKNPLSQVAIVSGKQGLRMLAAENDVTVIYPDEAEEFQENGVVKRKKTTRFRRHAVGGGMFGKWV